MRLRSLKNRELDAAEIVDPTLRAAYDACRRLNARHGRTYYLSTLLLPAAKRPAVHALYAFARHADDLVDTLDPTVDLPAKEQALTRWAERFARGATDHPVLLAVHDTVDRYGIPRSLFDDFLAAMWMDLTTTSYPTWDDLLGYAHGSAAVIGEQLIPVLGTTPGMRDAAVPYARDLGVAFQLANFIRDIGEDQRRGRTYLPLEDLADFGVSLSDLAAGVVDGRMRRLLGFEIARARKLFRSALPGIRLLDPTSRDCVRTAFTLYGGILDAVERADYQVFDQRVRIGPARRAAVAIPGVIRAVRSRHTHGP
ncbi:MAG TPA: phytoene/squalene synthase family protein [Mycobacteriales bacterium]|nr:phytoene/squalene synthase family protein [Mycobacteriales bacterium]